MAETAMAEERAQNPKQTQNIAPNGAVEPFDSGIDDVANVRAGPASPSG
jgi:hypothetical protein